MGLTNFCGIKYKLESSEGFDEYLKAFNIDLITRKMIDAVHPVVELRENNGEYTLSSSSSFKNTVIKFKLGEEFDEETADGRKVKSTITQEGDNMLVHVMKGEKESKIVREFSKEKLKITLFVDDIVGIRIYKAEA